MSLGNNVSDNILTVCILLASDLVRLAALESGKLADVGTILGVTGEPCMYFLTAWMTADCRSPPRC